MASMRDIKRRKNSIQGTQQITKAMKLVSTVKLGRARTGAENSRFYFDAMYRTMRSILEDGADQKHIYIGGNGSTRKAVLVIASNRGLAGGYNSSVAKLVTEDERFTPEDTDIYSIGSKGADLLSRAGFNIVMTQNEVIEDPSYHDAEAISWRLLADFEQGRIGEIYLVYTYFKNTLVQVPKLMKLLPVAAEDMDEPEEDDGLLMNFEMSEEDALKMLVPMYVSSMIFGALQEAAASENGARMQAMDNATKNAEDMIADLGLKYNRARQSAITQELTEIIAGSEAIGG